ncbi:deoxyribonuclease V [Spongorhabdus nitratireducens]
MTLSGCPGEFNCRHGDPENLNLDIAMDYAQARQQQSELAQQVIRTDSFGEIRQVAGADVGFEDNGQTTRAVISLMSWPQLELLDYRIYREPTRIPYIPGLLSFRECPALLECLQQLPAQPDLIFCDGQGIAHPRRLGVASHLGILANIPTIGVGKSRLTGEHQAVPDQRGAISPLTDNNEVIGNVLRTRTGVKPLYISTGHRVSLETATQLVLQAAPKYRLPEPIRWADGIASRRASFMKRLEHTTRLP